MSNLFFIVYFTSSFTKNNYKKNIEYLLLKYCLLEIRKKIPFFKFSIILYLSSRLKSTSVSVCFKIKKPLFNNFCAPRETHNVKTTKEQRNYHDFLIIIQVCLDEFAGIGHRKHPGSSLHKSLMITKVVI